ncbi:DUF4381 domain-containing protein [Microbulbifer yueqingensis]|uniref:DUF4381 domain-containing protein n=1 Tax=Microbulbifer yueqingensis TaxID=658219 RepID=A0A1G9A908_9GAMM|nr:DUF4381 domain-containing protein [Microbulbifer yueqingensis]SDK23741.1 protein of unknown function [Microbulbifer yueqingensis]
MRLPGSRQATPQPAPPQPAQPQLSPEQQELMAQLRDIHEPAPVGWWPPAPGWWLLAAMLVAVLIAALLWLQRARARAVRLRYRQEAVQLLKEIDPADTRAAETANEILKRVAVTSYSRVRAGRLTGSAWLQFLEQSSGLPCPPAARKALLEELYRRDRSSEEANRALVDYAIDWVRRHKQALPMAAARTQATEAADV